MNSELPDKEQKADRRGPSRTVVRIVLTLLVALASHGTVTVAAQYLWFRTSDLYSETMYIVRNSTDLKEKIGAPVVAGWPLVFRSIYRGVGDVTARLPVDGVSGRATVHLRAKNRGGSWEYQQLEARLEEDSSSVDLMPHRWRPQKLVLRGAGRLYFVGIGEPFYLDVADLARYYRDRYRVEITVLPPLPYQSHRESAIQMIRVLKAGYPKLVTDPQAVIIAVTNIDMDWFSWRDDERFAVISAAGLTPEQFRRQVSKSLGLLWFELPMNADSRSVLYDGVAGRVDLQLMTDDF